MDRDRSEGWSVFLVTPDAEEEESEGNDDRPGCKAAWQTWAVGGGDKYEDGEVEEEIARRVHGRLGAL